MPRREGPVTRMETLTVEDRLRERDRCQEHWYKLASTWVSGKTVLDVGAGTGYGMDILRAAGCKQVDGIDPLPLRPDITATRIEDIATASYDAIVCCDVIEHVEDDHKFLKEMLRVARDFVFISTPNWNTWHCQNKYHFREYTPEEMKALLDGQVYRTWQHTKDKPGDVTDILQVTEPNFGVRINNRPRWWTFTKDEWLSKLRAVVSLEEAHSISGLEKINRFLAEHYLSEGTRREPLWDAPWVMLNEGQGMCSSAAHIYAWLLEAGFGLLAYPVHIETPKGQGHYIVEAKLAEAEYATIDPSHQVVFKAPGGKSAPVSSYRSRPEWMAENRDPWTWRGEHFWDFFMRGPKTLNYFIGDKCNAECSICWQVPRRAKTPKSEWFPEMPLEVFTGILNRYADSIVSVSTCSFGEPTMNPDFHGMVKAVLELSSKCGPAPSRDPGGIHFDLVTNGSLLHHHADLMRLPGDITISMDAITPEIYAKIRRGLRYADVRRNIEYFADRKSRHIGRTMGINFVVTQDNVGDITGMAKWCQEIGIERLTVIRGQLLDVTDARGRDVTDDAPVVEAMKYIREKLPTLRLVDEFTRLSTTGVIEKPSHFCYLPWQAIDVNPRGQCFACCRSHHNPVGNASEDVWHGDVMQRLRNQIVNGNVDPIEFSECAACGNLGAKVRGQ